TNQGGDGNDLTRAVAGPVATITEASPVSPVEGTPVTVSGVVADAAGAIDTMTVTWAVTGPNGFATATTPAPFAGAAGGTGTGIAFTPPDDGSYTVVLTAHDQFG